jgi:thioester reductase-like protein
MLTGVTGFLGKVLLEELLRQRDETLVEQVYVLIRPRGVLSAEERFWREVVPSKCFSRLPPDWASCVVVVEGQLERPDLDLNQSARDEITGRVTHLLHVAASISFDLPPRRSTARFSTAPRSRVTCSNNPATTTPIR